MIIAPIDEKKWCLTCNRWVLFMVAPLGSYCFICDTRVRCSKPEEK